MVNIIDFIRDLHVPAFDLELDCATCIFATVRYDHRSYSLYDLWYDYSLASHTPLTFFWSKGVACMTATTKISIYTQP